MNRPDNTVSDLQSFTGFTSLLAHIPGPACIINLEGDVLFANQICREILGMPEHTGETLVNIVNQTNALLSIAADISAIKSGQSISASRDIILTSRLGTSSCYRIMVSSFSAGDTAYILLLGCDISAKHSCCIECNRVDTIIDLIQELTDFQLFDESFEGKIQQIISRIGAAMMVSYASYLQVGDRASPSSLQEEYLWSYEHGFLIGNDLNGLMDEPNFVPFISTLKKSQPVVIREVSAQGTLKTLLKERECGSLVMVPLIRDLSLVGIFALWDRSESRIWTSLELKILLVVARIIANQFSYRHIEKILAHSEQKFQTLIDQIGDMYFMTDKAGHLIKVSSSMMKNLGFKSIESLEGISLDTIIHPPEFWPIFLSDVISQEGVKDYEIQLMTKDNRILYSSMSCRLIYDDDGMLLGIEGVIRDISRRKQYEDLLSDIEWKLEQAQKIARMGVWSFDHKLGRFRVSPEVFSLLGVPPEQNYIVLDDFITRTYPDDAKRFLQHFPLVVSQGSEFDFEFRISLKEQKFRYLRIKGKPLIKKGIVQGSFGILQDITERKDVENHLMKYATELEQKTVELDALRSQLLDMNRDLEKRVRMRTIQIENLLKQKDEFIQIIGHDLKTPLTPLFSLLPYIRKKIVDPDLCILLDNCIEDVSHIKNLVTTILDLAQMNSLYLISDLQEIHVREMIEQIISDNAYLIHQKSIMIINAVPEDCSVYMSPMHFETILGNVIGNAIKYSYIDGHVEIHAQSQDDFLTISVKDDGIGIKSEDIPRIFDEFYRADDSRHERGSHGLGLTIAKRVVQMYHGTLRVESDGLGKGSVFYIQFRKNPEVFRKRREGLVQSIAQTQEMKKNVR